MRVSSASRPLGSTSIPANTPGGLSSLRGRGFAMLKQLVSDLPKPHVHLGSFLLRLGLAIIFMFHGYLKVIQDGGRGWSNSLSPETQVAVAWGELVCGCALFIGLFSRIAALGLAVIMVGAITLQTGQYDFIYI